MKPAMAMIARRMMMMIAVAGRTDCGSYRVWVPEGNRRLGLKERRGPHGGGPRRRVGEVRHRGAGWEAIRSRLGLRRPRHGGTDPSPYPPHYRPRSVVT